MKKVWANKKIIQSWDRAILAVGGFAAAVFFTAAALFGDPAAEPIDLEALDRPAMEVECLPVDMRTGAVIGESLC